jgi:multidrug efflux pump subunit AcrA (membrane-fusion protein)
MRLLIPVCLIALTLTAIAQDTFLPPSGNFTESSDDAADGAMRAENVYVTHINKVDIPATAEGVLKELKVEEGDTVSIDDVLAVIDSKVVALNKDLKEAEELEARVKATDDVNLRDAMNNEKLALAEAKSFELLAEDGAVGFYDMKRKQLEAEKQKLRIELAQLEEKTKKIEVVKKQTELKMALAELEKREVKAPATGFIEKRLANLGQWLQPGTPIATLIQMDRLRVQGDLSGVAYAGRVVKGAPVRVKIYATNADPIEIQGKLGFVSMELDGNGSHRVWVEIENRLDGDDWLVKPGMKAEIELQ